MKHRSMKLFRLVVLVSMPLLFLVAWHIIPELLGATSLRWMSGIVTFLWGLEIFFFQRLLTITPSENLSGKENGLLLWKLRDIRKRVWWIGSVSLFCAISMWILAATDLPMSSPLYATFPGVLLGISLSYLILIPSWVEETTEFSNRVRAREVDEKKRATASKDLS